MPKTFQKEIKKITRQIVENYHPEKIILFGSYAWGKPNENSDVDLFIVKETNKRRTDRQLEVDKILSDRNIPLDVLVYTPQEIKNRMLLEDFFVKNIIQQGKTVYAKK